MKVLDYLTKVESLMQQLLDFFILLFKSLKICANFYRKGLLKKLHGNLHLLFVINENICF